MNAKVLSDYEDHVGLWAKELAGWVPEEIFDAHVHLGLPEFMGEMSAERLKEPLSTFRGLPWGEALEFYSHLYSGKQLVGLFAFGFPLREVDVARANDYLAHVAALDPRVKPFLMSHPTDTRETVRQFRAAEKHGVRFLGVKPYFDFLGKSNYETTMPEFIPRSLLEFMDSERLILMLHTSGRGMGEKDAQDFVRSAADDYPRMAIILAHMGRYLEPRQFFAFLDSDVLDRPNVYLDVSSATSAEVLEAALAREDLRSRLLFASDLPFGIITGMEYHSPETLPGLFLTRDDYSWSDPEVNRRLAHLRPALTYNVYHVLKSLKEAWGKLNLEVAAGERLKRDLFSRNALCLCAR